MLLQRRAQGARQTSVAPVSCSSITDHLRGSGGSSLCSLDDSSRRRAFSTSTSYSYAQRWADGLGSTTWHSNSWRVTRSARDPSTTTTRSAFASASAASASWSAELSALIVRMSRINCPHLVASPEPGARSRHRAVDARQRRLQCHHALGSDPEDHAHVTVDVPGILVQAEVAFRERVAVLIGALLR